MFQYTVPGFYKDLTDQAQKIHAQERRITLDSIRLVAKLEEHKVWYYMDMSVEKFATYIGLTPSKYWKRLSASRVINQYPRALKLFEAGEIDVCHLCLIAGRITDANSEVLLNGVRGKTKREAESFVSRVLNTGELLDREGFVEISIRLTETQIAELDRAREVLSHSGKMPSTADLVRTAIADLLEKRDPMKKAERAECRKKRKVQAMNEVAAVDQSPEVCVGENEAQAFHATPDLADTNSARQTNQNHSRQPIPARSKHQVFSRDQGQCTFINPDGSRCPSRNNLEIDHKQMVCRGGANELENLQLRCRYHNRLCAELELGRALPKRGEDWIAPGKCG